jgi:hypothetical protein
VGVPTGNENGRAGRRARDARDWVHDSLTARVARDCTCHDHAEARRRGAQTHAAAAARNAAGIEARPAITSASRARRSGACDRGARLYPSAGPSGRHRRSFCLHLRSRAVILVCPPCLRASV